MSRILVVDDEAPLRDMLQDYLGMHGFDVRAVADGAGLWRELRAAAPDLVILDVNLASENGHDLARQLVVRSRAGVIMLTAVGDLPHRLEGLRAGADDYMVKPFEPRELLARVRSVLRRVGEGGDPPDLVPFGRCGLDRQGRRLVTPDGSEVALTTMEFELLTVFLRHPRQVLSRERLSNLAHDRDLPPGDRSIDIRITRLRRKIEPDPNHPAVIATVRGEGYVYRPD